MQIDMTTEKISNTASDRVLSTKELAEYLGISERTLERQRVDGSGVPFCKIGTGARAAVRYRLSDVHSWLENQSFRSTAEYEA